MALTLMSFDIPETPPVPEPRPDETVTAGANPEASDPEAPAKTEDGAEAASENAEDAVPEEPPVPEERADNPPPPPPPEPKPVAEETGAFARCTAALTALGADYEVLETIDDPGSCGIDKPLKVSVVLEGVKLVPEGTMRCETALAIANWAKTYVEPTATIALDKDAKLTEIHQASTYVCRTRNSVADAKISEHAKGNAVDVRSLTFSDGTTVDMEPRRKDGTATGAFQRTVSAAACLYFNTVLSPGSDATHQDHMHLDVITRKSGYRYCR
ncbi:hypothetical protein TM49_11210 [Martelella endophytica]|uniref:Extensin-like C-terminal domain-containing protein n=1 Tax=Martelella endophytica TaxID=1486262 RepID=A0A0D5LVZ9_MAREN|nr:hypothetical protein TM49_11210 [Martelella endophytica]